MSQDVYPLAVLIDDLRKEDTATRVNSMKRIGTISLALGPERTRDELLPFLEEAAQEDEDEVLVVLAEELGGFVPYVGQEHASIIIQPLTTLAACEEPSVREAAVKSLSQVANEMTPADLHEHFLRLVKDLSTSDWFSSRISATGLYVAALRGAPESTKELLMAFRELTTDDAPMVRRAAATALPELVAEAKQQNGRIDHENEVAAREALTEMFFLLAEDEQDSVRLLSVPVVISMSKNFPGEWDSSLLDRTYQLLDDKSWRVRYMAADHFAELARAAGPDETAKMIQVFVTLSKDAESEVRTAIFKQVVDFSEMLTVDQILNDVVPCLEALTEDPSEHVREALATQISYLSPRLGRELTIRHLLPLFLEMLKDENSEVRLQIISNLQVINEIIGVDLLSQSLLPAIADLAKDKQWRVLLAIIEYSPLLAEQLGEEFFNRELVPFVMNWMWDPVWAIRDAAAKNLIKLSEVFGTPWLEKEILPKIVVLNPNANYLYRLTSLLAVKTIVPVLSAPVLKQDVLPFVMNLCDDPVPNIRFSCAKTLKEVAAILSDSSTVSDTIVPLLQKYQEDRDADVRFFVNDALESIRGSDAVQTPIAA